MSAKKSKLLSSSTAPAAIVPPVTESEIPHESVTETKTIRKLTKPQPKSASSTSTDPTPGNAEATSVEAQASNAVSSEAQQDVVATQEANSTQATSPAQSAKPRSNSSGQYIMAGMRPVVAPVTKPTTRIPANASLLRKATASTSAATNAPVVPATTESPEPIETTTDEQDVRVPIMKKKVKPSASTSVPIAKVSASASAPVAATTEDKSFVQTHVKPRPKRVKQAPPPPVEPEPVEQESEADEVVEDETTAETEQGADDSEVLEPVEDEPQPVQVTKIKRAPVSSAPAKRIAASSTAASAAVPSRTITKKQTGGFGSLGKANAVRTVARSQPQEEDTEDVEQDPNEEEDMFDDIRSPNVRQAHGVASAATPPTASRASAPIVTVPSTAEVTGAMLVNPPESNIFGFAQLMGNKWGIPGLESENLVNNNKFKVNQPIYLRVNVQAVYAWKLILHWTDVSGQNHIEDLESCDDPVPVEEGEQKSCGGSTVKYQGSGLYFLLPSMRLIFQPMLTGLELSKVTNRFALMALSTVSFDYVKHLMPSLQTQGPVRRQPFTRPAPSQGAPVPLPERVQQSTVPGQQHQPIQQQQMPIQSQPAQFGTPQQAQKTSNPSMQQPQAPFQQNGQLMQTQQYPPQQTFQQPTPQPQLQPQQLQPVVQQPAYYAQPPSQQVAPHPQQMQYPQNSPNQNQNQQPYAAPVPMQGHGQPPYAGLPVPAPMQSPQQPYQQPQPQPLQQPQQQQAFHPQNQQPQQQPFPGVQSGGPDSKYGHGSQPPAPSAAMTYRPPHPQQQQQPPNRPTSAVQPASGIRRGPVNTQPPNAQQQPHQRPTNQPPPSRQMNRPPPSVNGGQQQNQQTQNQSRRPVHRHNANDGSDDE